MSTSGMVMVEPGEDVGEKGLGIVVGNAETDGAPQAFSRQSRNRGRLGLHDPSGIFDQFLALARQFDAAPLLYEQRASQLLFQPANVHRDRRLRLVHPLGGAREGAEVHNGEEGAELVGVEHGNQSHLLIGFSTNIRWTDQYLTRIKASSAALVRIVAALSWRIGPVDLMETPMRDSHLFAPLSPFTAFAAQGGDSAVAQLRRALAWPAKMLEERRARAQLAGLSERELSDFVAGGRDLGPEALPALKEAPEERAQRARAIRAWYGKAA